MLSMNKTKESKHCAANSNFVLHIMQRESHALIGRALGGSTMLPDVRCMPQRCFMQCKARITWHTAPLERIGQYRAS
jgi:hypothetical protein